MRIEIWSDVVCPWCYIGKRRLETALAAFRQAHPDAEVDVHWRSYELDPSSPRVPTQTVAEHLGAKYGGGAAGGQQMIDRVEAVAAEEGLVYRLGEAQRANTVDAHRLLHLARDLGVQADLKEALLAAYFTRGESMGDHEVLRRSAVEVGMDPARVDAVLASDEYADAVLADVEQARVFGATGVPFYVVDRKYGISGAQATEVFTQVLERAWEESRPKLDLLAGADACGPDGCAI
jgi:predicted DsbA family dithiol-disulfide isomerase